MADRDAEKYFEAIGREVPDIEEFILRMKDAGYWSELIEFWPLRGDQNLQSSFVATKALGVRGRHELTLVNAPPWRDYGLELNGTNMFARCPSGFQDLRFGSTLMGFVTGHYTGQSADGSVVNMSAAGGQNVNGIDARFYPSTFLCGETWDGATMNSTGNTTLKTTHNQSCMVALKTNNATAGLLVDHPGHAPQAGAVPYSSVPLTISAAPATAFTQVCLGGIHMTGSTFQFLYKGLYHGAMLFNRVLTDLECQHINRISRDTWHKATHAIFEGDSITAGIPGSNDPPWPAVLCAQTGWFGKVHQMNRAVPSEYAQTIAIDYGSQIRVATPSKTAANVKGIAFVSCGTNDIGILNSTPAGVMVHLRTIWSKLRQDRCKVVAMTNWARSGLSATQLANLNTLTQLIIQASQAGEFDQLIRPDLLYPDSTNVAVYFDGIHPSTATNIAFGEYLAQNVTLPV